MLYYNNRSIKIRIFFIYERHPRYFFHFLVPLSLLTNANTPFVNGNKCVFSSLRIRMGAQVAIASGACNCPKQHTKALVGNAKSMATDTR